MGSSCDGPQCRGTSFSEYRQKRSATDFYDLLDDHVDVGGDDDDDDDDGIFGRVVFTPYGQDSRSRRSKRNVPPAAIPSR